MVGWEVKREEVALPFNIFCSYEGRLAPLGEYSSGDREVPGSIPGVSLSS